MGSVVAFIVLVTIVIAVVVWENRQLNKIEALYQRRRRPQA